MKDTNIVILLDKRAIGKSELLKTLILRDILRGDGSVILLEPHGDLSEQVAKLVKDKTRLVYVDPFLGKK